MKKRAVAKKKVRTEPYVPHAGNFKVGNPGGPGRPKVPFDPMRPYKKMMARLVRAHAEGGIDDLGEVAASMFVLAKNPKNGRTAVEAANHIRTVLDGVIENVPNQQVTNNFQLTLNSLRALNLTREQIDRLDLLIPSLVPEGVPADFTRGNNEK